MNKKFETKTYRGRLQFKQAEGQEGQFRAIFATMNVIDHDDDVTLPGAFGEQDVLIETWNHGWDLPVGKGTIHEEGDEAIVDGRFFLEIPEAMAHYIVAKELSDKQEWSYTFRILEWKHGEWDGQEVRILEKLEVIGVSQVSKGAGIDTRTTDIKSALKNLLDESAPKGDEDPGDEGDDEDPGDDVDTGDELDDGDESEAGDGNESGARPEDAQTYFELLARS